MGWPDTPWGLGQGLATIGIRTIHIRTIRRTTILQERPARLTTIRPTRVLTRGGLGTVTVTGESATRLVI